MQKSKRIVMAMILALRDNKVALPIKSRVQDIKGENIVSLKAAGKLIPSDHAAPGVLLQAASEWLKKLRKFNDKKFAEEFPAISELWNGGVAAVIGNHTINLKEIKSKPALLAQYNLLAKKKGLPPIKSFKGSVKQLEDRIAKVRKSIERDIPPWKVAPPAVAEGAYASEMEAKYRTGHTTNGKPKSVEKMEQKKQAIISKRLKDVPVRKIASTGEFITLSDVARAQGIEPKIARGKARRYAKEITALQLDKKSKYKFPQKNAQAVAAILKRDSRRK